MTKLVRTLLGVVCAAGLLSQAPAQQPGGRDKKEPPKDQPKDFSNSSIVTKMMAFDKNKDGKLTKDEVTDTRLHRLFDMADANKDGVVTKDELIALAAKLEAEGGPGGDRGGPGGPGGRGPGGPGGPGGRGPGGPPQPGQVLSPRFQDELRLTPEQKKQLEELQKDVDTRLSKILTDDQKKQLKDMRDRPPGPPGGPGGRGPGGPGGPPER